MARKAAAPDAGGAGATAKAPRGNLVPAVVVAVGLLGGGFIMGGKGSDPAAPAAAAPAEPAHEKPEPGQVVVLDPITLNLADGRFLKVGLALQLPAEKAGAKKGHGGEADGDKGFAAPALDEAIAVLGDYTYEQLASPGGRSKAKADLSRRVAERYHGEVMEVYFTEFVMQ